VDTPPAHAQQSPKERSWQGQVIPAVQCECAATVQEITMAVDKDRVKGAAKNVGGKLKEAAGKLVGDEKLKTEGRADQAKGKVQNTVGGIKDSVRDAIDPDRKAGRH